MDLNEKHRLMFIQLIKTFESTAWIQLGKIKNPNTDRLERNLMQAQYSIDMLDMLKAKTEGNLTEEESRLLNEIITNLKLNFVEEMEKEKQEKEKEKAEAAGKKEAEKGETKQEEKAKDSAVEEKSGEKEKKKKK
ncbi:MAG TPA: DUF1844 domain-containing protein [Bacteroidetes bacterium]|nr:DUF1844 domain-containing protein [Bacteroidota bacterium]